MTTKFKFIPRTFRDVTKQKPDVLKVVNANAPNDVITKIFERKDTVIIHSKNSSSNHASISNAKGHGFIQEWEIRYTIEHILRVELENVSILVSDNGVVHIYANKGNTL